MLSFTLQSALRSRGCECCLAPQYEHRSPSACKAACCPLHNRLHPLPHYSAWLLGCLVPVGLHAVAFWAAA